MDIARMSVILSQAKLQQAASLSVMKMAMGNAKQNGQALAEMLQTCRPKTDVSTTHLGQNIDIRV